MLSQELRNAVKLSAKPQYQLAHEIPVHPSTLSAWLNGIYPVRDGDPRVEKLAKLLGVPAERAFAGRTVPTAAPEIGLL